MGHVLQSFSGVRKTVGVEEGRAVPPGASQGARAPLREYTKSAVRHPRPAHLTRACAVDSQGHLESRAGGRDVEPPKGTLGGTVSYIIVNAQGR